MDNARVYSYLRFSDPKQAAGGSIDRQIAYAKRWAEERGLPLDQDLTLRDEGLSAYHQRHIKQGALGAFLVAVDAGKIPPGSVLIVEGLDRLSRAEPIQAQAQLAQIVNAGITVVTASDSKEYNRERLKANPMDLVYSLLVMIRAHEESDTKSKRVKAAIRRQCEGWIKGTFRGVIRNGKDPRWVKWNGERFELIPERAEAVRTVINLFLEGHGATRVMSLLRDRGVALENIPGNATSLYKLLKRPDLIGARLISVGGEEFTLEGYYPALLSLDEYHRLQLANEARVRRKGKGEIPGIITGLNILCCGYCGQAVVAQNIMGRTRKQDGTPQDGHRRLYCCGISLGTGCAVSGSVSVVPVEKALLAFCSDQMNLSSLIGGGNQADIARAALAALRTKIAELERQLERVTAAMLADEDATPLAFVRKARELEAQLDGERRALKLAEASLSRAAEETPAAAEAWRAIVKGAMALDYEDRMRARQLVKDTFERIVIYHQGVTPEDGSKHIDLLLMARAGGSRILRIDRKSGAWMAQEDFQAAGTS